LVTELLRRGSVDAVYAYDKFGSKVGEDVRGRVNEFGKIDELAGKLGSVNGRVVVVTGSTTDAVWLRDKLGNAEVIYLPEYYEDAAKKVLKGVDLEVARVRHEGLGEGISPSMLREGLPSEVKPIRELSPGKGDLKDVIRDFLKKAPVNVATQAVIIGLKSLIEVDFAVSLVGSLAGRFLESVVGKWRKNRDEVLGGFVRLVNKAREVKNYLCDERLCDERLEAVFDEVAYEWGLNIDEFAKTITNIANLAKGKLLTEEDVKKINDKLKNIEEALEKIEEELKKVREMVGGLSVGVEVFFINDFEDGLVYPTVKLVGGELMVLGEYGYHEVVRTGFFSTLTNEVKQRLGAGSLVVLTGPKGVGKSTLATVTIWNLLRSGEVGMVLRVRELPDGEVVERFRSFIENFLVRDWKYFGNLIILYDPTGVYGQIKGVEAPSKLETTVRNVLEAVRRAIENAKSILGREPSARVGVLIILPTDLYNALSNDTKGKLESYRLDALLNDTEFLAELIREYTRTKSNPNGCALSDRELGELAGKVAGFDSGHALIARLIGEELARNNCSAREIEELLSKAKGKAEAFMILYINRLFKVQEDLDTVKALVEIFALRRPFVDLVRPGGPILTPGIIGLIGEERGAKTLYGAEGKELRSWLAHRQHDLIEEAIEKLLKCIVSGGEECKELGDALEPWKETIGVMGSLREVSEKVRDESTAVEYFVGNYGEKLANALKVFSNECWKRVALIIGYASAGIPIVSRPEDLFVLLPEDLRKSVVESLSDALKECGVDYYLLVGNEIPPLIKDLVIMDLAYKRALAEAFVDKYDEAVAEIERVLNIVRKRGIIDEAESFYGLGLASIIAAAWLDRNVNPSDADIALRMMSFAIHRVALPQLIKPVLDALEPLYDKAPQRYLEVLVSALDKASRPSILGFILGFMCPDFDTVRYILNEFDNILNKYRDRVKGHAWTLVRAIKVLINSLYNCLLNCDDYKDYWDAPFRTELERIASRVAGFLNEIDRLNPSLDIFAWAHASLTALKNKCVRALVESVLGVDVVNKKAKEIAGGLSGLRESVQELIRDKDFMDLIMEETSDLLYEWAHYKLDNDELYEAEELFNEATRERREIGDFQNYLDSSNWALRAKAIRSKLAGDELVELVNGFRQLYEEAKKQSDTLLLIDISDMLDDIFGGYLVSLALKGDDEEIRRIEELLEEQGQGPEGYWRAPILIRLTLSALLCTRGELSGELKGRLFVEPWELIEIHGSGYTGITSQGKLRRALIKYFRRWISKGEVLDLLKKLDLDAESLVNELRGWIHELSDELLLSLARFSFCSELYQRYCSSEHLAYMLYALINGNEKLAKAHALYGAASAAGKLPARLFLEAYKECRERCDLKNESFRLALARLFFYHYSV
jgi:KaiC/GvpD/RAD55 family RecA-like ATPase